MIKTIIFWTIAIVVLTLVVLVTISKPKEKPDPLYEIKKSPENIIVVPKEFNNVNNSKG